MIAGTVVLCGAMLAGGGAPPLTVERHELREEFHRSYALAPHGHVTLDNINGNVRVVGWDRGEIRVDAVKRAMSSSRLAEARIDVESRPGSIFIRTRYPESDVGASPASVEYTVMVPRDSSLDAITLVNGELDISGVTGLVKASAVNGTVRARKLSGDARLSTVNGLLEASFDRLDGAKDISLHSVNGSITLAVPYDASAAFRATNVTGPIVNDFGLPVSRGAVAGNQLSGVVRHGCTRIHLDTINGAISIVPLANGKRVRFT